jgi:Transcriptional regulator of aromatic amino acids metabolism
MSTAMWQDTLAELRRFAGRSPLSVFILGEVTSKQRNEALHELIVSCGRKACRPQATTPFKLPTVPASMVVVDDVAALSLDEQHALLQWLDRHCDAMVLSFAIEPVFPLVMKGTFLERLFYRINIITLTVNDKAAWSRADARMRSS